MGVMEKVSKGLERCLSFDPSCGDCPYYSCDDMFNECERNLKNDVLALLKQEAVKPTWQQGKAYCGSCGKRIPLKIGARYCNKCGKAVKWQ